MWFISFLIQKAFSDFVVEFASVNLQGLFQTSNFPCAEPNANEQSFLCVCVCAKVHYMYVPRMRKFKVCNRSERFYYCASC